MAAGASCLSCDKVIDSSLSIEALGKEVRSAREVIGFYGRG
jgi:hypothetical protein